MSEAAPSPAMDHAAEDAPQRSPSPEAPAVATDSEDQHDARGVSAEALSPGRSGASLHASLRCHSAQDSLTRSPPVSDYSPRRPSPPALSYRVAVIPPASSHDAPGYQPERVQRIVMIERAGYGGSPHSDRRVGVQSRTPSPSPSPTPAPGPGGALPALQGEAGAPGTPLAQRAGARARAGAAPTLPTVATSAEAQTRLGALHPATS